MPENYFIKIAETENSEETEKISGVWKPPGDLNLLYLSFLFHLCFGPVGQSFDLISVGIDGGIHLF